MDTTNTYCAALNDCPFFDCEYHIANLSDDEGTIYVSGRDAVCRRYISFLVDEVERGNSNG